MIIKAESRSKKVMVNAIMGIANKLFILLLTFVSRTVFIWTLGADYLGVNGLFSNILTLLSLAELGIGNVLTFSLYKPLAEHDQKAISKLMTFYRKIYIVLSIAVFTLGLSVIPFMNYLVKCELPNNEVITYYIIFLADSAVSYLAVYKATLIKADQRNYIIDTTNSISRIVVTILQILVLVLWKNYILYLLLNVVRTLFQNAILTYIASKDYKIQKSEDLLSKDEKNLIISNVKSTFLYKLGQIIINYTDNILISVILGTVVVGYYSNYSMIVTQVQMFIGILTTAIIASVGNLSTEKDETKSYNIFKHLIFFFHILSAFCSICFIVLFNDFIELWIGNDYLLSFQDVLAITFSFYIQNIINPVWMYREAYGLFKEIRYVMIITAIINILLSIILGTLWGVCGIILSTGLSRILTTVWYEPIILNKKIFHQKTRHYYFLQIKYLICTMLSFILTYIFANFFEPSIINIIIKIGLSFINTIVIFSLLNYKNPSFIFWKDKCISVISKNKKEL